MSSAKAFVAAAVAFLAALLAEWVGGGDAFQLRDLVVAALAALTAFGAVYATRNRSHTL